MNRLTDSLGLFLKGLAPFHQVMVGEGLEPEDWQPTSYGVPALRLPLRPTSFTSKGLTAIKQQQIFSKLIQSVRIIMDDLDRPISWQF